MPDSTETIILICTRCGGQDAASAMRAELAPHCAEGTRFRAVDCLAGCDFPPTVGVQAAGKASYLFGTIATSEDLSAIAAFSHQFAASDTGWTNSTQRPPALSGKTLARLPAIKGDAA